MKKFIILSIAVAIAASCTVYKDSNNYDNNLKNLCISLVACCADQPAISIVEALSGGADVFNAKWEKSGRFYNSVLPDNLDFVIRKAEADSTWTVEGKAGKGSSSASGNSLVFSAVIKLLPATLSPEFPNLEYRIEKLEYDESNGYLACLDKAAAFNFYWTKSGSPSYVTYNLTKKGECKFNTFRSNTIPADWCILRFDGNYLSSCRAEIGTD